MLATREIAFIPLGLGAQVGVGQVEFAASLTLAGAAMPDEMADQALTSTRLRSRWRWALRHPFGAQYKGL